MKQVKTVEETLPLILQLSPAIEMTSEQFFEFCQLNRNYCFERNTKGELMIMPPTGSETGNRNFKLAQQLANWTDEDGTGIGFDSSTGFQLPNGAERSPDVAWIKLERWEKLTPKQQTKLAPICPDFVVELRSPSDRLEPIKEKLVEYIENGASLGWLIDRKNRKVYIYRPQQEVKIVDNPTTLKGDPVLPGFTLNMAKIW